MSENPHATQTSRAACLWLGLSTSLHIMSLVTSSLYSHHASSHIKYLLMKRPSPLSDHSTNSQPIISLDQTLKPIKVLDFSTMAPAKSSKLRDSFKLPHFGKSKKTCEQTQKESAIDTGKSATTEPESAL